MLDTDPQIGTAATAARQKFLEPGLPLRISDLTDNLGGYATSVSSVDGRTLWIGLPIRRDGMLSLSVGQLVSVRFDRPGDAVYLFDSVVANVRDDDESPFGLAVPVNINRRPHRSDARLALVLDAQFDDRTGATRPGKVVDLSAGGLGLISDAELAPGDRLVVRTDLPGPGSPLSIEQRVEVCSVSLYGRTPGGRTLHQFGLKFLDVDDQVREAIITSVIWNLTQNPEVL